MQNKLKAIAEKHPRSKVTATFDRNQSIGSDTYAIVKGKVVSDQDAEVISTCDDISRQWYQESSRQASASFNIAIGLAAATAIFTVVTAIAVCTGNVSAAVATASVGLTSGAVGSCSFKLYKDANKRLDKVAKEILEK